MDGIEYDAFVGKHSHPTGVLVYSTFHSRKNLKLAFAELKHLGLKFHAFLSSVLSISLALRTWTHSPGCSDNISEGVFL